MNGSRRVRTWVFAGIFAALAVGALVLSFKWFIGMNNTPAAGTEMLVNAVPLHHGIYPWEIVFLAVFVAGGVLVGLLHSVDESRAGGALAITKGAFYGALVLVVLQFSYALLFILTVI
jgi:hypothetical protein